MAAKNEKCGNKLMRDMDGPTYEVRQYVMPMLSSWDCPASFHHFSRLGPGSVESSPCSYLCSGCVRRHTHPSTDLHSSTPP